MKESFAAKAQSLSKSQGEDKQTKLPLISERSQHGSLILEAIVVLGMVATFTPLLYKHVADRRADIENINRANTLLYLQQKTEEYLKRPENIKTLVTELGHNEHKEIYPSELGAGNNFDGRYIIGIRREDEDNKPVLKAMIIDAVNTGSDLRAAKVAELIGISAGIYTAVDPDAAWGINGMWSEPLSRYFTTTNFPTGAVAVTTEYNKEKYRVSISDILVDADLDMGEFNLTAEQIKAINIAAENGTIDQLIAQDVTVTNKITTPKLVITDKICFEKDGEEKCAESLESIGDKTDLQLVQECNAGMTYSCVMAFDKGLNTTCAKVDAVYDAFNDTYPTPKIYMLTYANGTEYAGKIRVQCEGTSFEVNNISTPSLADPVTMVGGSAFSITEPGWYQIKLMGEQGSVAAGSDKKGSGGVLIASKQFSKEDILTIKGIKGGKLSDATSFGGAGVAFMDSINTNTSPVLVAGGGTSAGSAGGGYEGGYGSESQGYSWNGSLGNNVTYCDGSANCNTATGGAGLASPSGWGGTGYCKSGYICTSIAGGNISSDPQNWSASIYGNRTFGYASITYCGASQSDCPATCISDSDCLSSTPFCENATCSATKSCSADTDCPNTIPFCENSICSATKSCVSDSDCSGAMPYCSSNLCSEMKSCVSNSDCTSDAPYCNTNLCVPIKSGAVLSGAGSYKTVTSGMYKVVLKGGNAVTSWSSDYWYVGSGGVLTAYKKIPKGVTLTVKSIRGGSWNDGYKSSERSGAGMVLFEDEIPVLAAGGGGCSGMVGGGGYVGGSGKRVSGYNWTGATGSSGVSCDGKCTANGSGSDGGKGYCESDYSCIGENGANSAKAGASASVYFCGPALSSPCP